MGVQESKFLEKEHGKARFTRTELTNIVAYLEGHVIKLLRKAEALSAHEGQGWLREYASFSSYHSKPATMSDKFPLLNRYKNIKAYDDTRVVVQPNAYNGNCDYVNANNVPGYGDVNYIASQGPVPEAFNAFWQMIWEQQTNIIVMVTNEIESGKLKCHRYWPRDGGENTYGAFTVFSVKRRDKTHYITTRLLIRNNDTGEERKLTHFLYTAWPDHGVPNTAGEMLTFRKAVNKEISSTAPILIHCSAGVGRTGTYIAVDTLIRRLEASDGSLDPADILHHLRSHRAFLVQTLLQYQFVFKALLEAINKRLQRAKNALNNAGPVTREDQLAQMTILEGEMAGVNDEFVNLAGIDEEVEKRLMAEEGVVDHTPWADVRHDTKVDDKITAANVSRKERVESLMTYVTSESWRSEVDDIESRGYKKNVADLTTRITSLAHSAHEDAWLQRYTKMSDRWHVQQDDGGEDYDLTASLDPLESRIISLAQQREAWVRKSQDARQALEKEFKDKIATLGQRFEALEHHITGSEERWRERGDGLRGEAVVEHRRDTEEKIGGVRDRLVALASRRGEWKERGDGFRGVLDETPEQKRKKEEARIKQEQEEEARIKAEIEAEEERKRLEELKAQEPVPPPELVKGSTHHVEKKKFKFFSLKKAKPKERPAHPMIAEATKNKKK